MKVIEKVKPDTLLVFFLLAPSIAMVFFLSTITETGRFNNTLIFFMLALGSLVGLAYLKFAKPDDDPIKWFQGLAQRHKQKDLMWIGIGYIAVLAAAYFLSAIHPVVVLITSGFVMFFVLSKTQSLLAPIAVHGAYNTTVLILQNTLKNSFLSTSPIRIPPVGIELQNVPSLISDAIWQFMLVASAEELVKLAAASAIALGMTSVLGADKKIAGVIGIVFSVLLWSVSHLVVAIR